jgi:hypothetical protein
MCFVLYFLRYALSMYIPLSYYILNIHRAGKYGRHMIKGLRISGYTARGQVSPLYQAKFVSRPLSKIQPFHIYPYCIRSWINIGLGNIEGPWVGGKKFQVTLIGARSPHCIKQNVFGAQLSKIQPFHIYTYCITSWINIGLGNIEGPWLGGWKFQGTLLGAKSSRFIKQNVFSAPLSKIQPYIYCYCIISWINIRLGNMESPWLGGWKFQGTLLGARFPHCIKQNLFRNHFVRYSPSIWEKSTNSFP